MQVSHYCVIIDLPTEAVLGNGVHLHDEIAGLPTQIVTFAGGKVQLYGGGGMKEAGQHGEAVGPAQYVPIRIHEPVAPRVRQPEDQDGEKHECR